MYRLSPHRPVSEIVSELRTMERCEAETVLGRCAAYSVADGSPEAMLRLALAYYVLTETRLDGPTMAEMVDVMRTQGVARLAGRDQLN